MDFNGNGRLDVISGSYHPGNLYLFAREPDGSFAAGQIIKGADGEPVNVGPAAHVFAVDWTGNGSLDLIVGNIQGQVHFIPNEGTNQEPKFGEPQPLQAGGKAITVGGGDAGPAVADWDGDGHPDLLVGGGDGSVLFFRNTGQRRDDLPVLEDPKPLIAASGFDGPEDRSGARAKVHVTDFNGDGRPDLLVGDYRSVQVRRAAPTPEQQARLAELRQEQQRLQEQVSQAMREALEGLPPGEDARQRLQSVQEEPEVKRLLERLRAVATEASELEPSGRRTDGNVWFYARKSDAEPARARQ